MRKRWIVALGMLALALAIGGWAEAVAVSSCDQNAGTKHIVSVAGSAAAIGANGYDNTNCDCIIDVSIPVTVNPLTIRCHDISILGPDPASASGKVEIINNAANSQTTLTATKTDMVISEASLKAHKTLRLVCQGTLPDCNITSDLSELIAALDFANPQAGGDLFIIAEGSVDIQTTTTHGGNILEITAKKGSLTLLCQPGGDNGCRDPVLSSKAVELCGTCPPGDTCPPDPRVAPTIFPCDVMFPTGADLTAVCFPTPPGVACNGGAKEKRFTAQGDINITGSEISAIDHVTFTSKGGRWLAAGTKLTAESVVAVIKGDGTSPSIDLSNASITTSAHTSITAGSMCPALPATCVLAQGVDITASNIIIAANSNNGRLDLCGTADATLPGPPLGATVIVESSGLPTFNGDSTRPYSRIVAAFETILDSTTDCPALFGASINGVIDP